LDVELPSDEDILESIATYGRPCEYMHSILFFVPKMETLQVDHQRNHYHEPSDGLYLKKYHA
jgi:hypothetical protein